MTCSTPGLPVHHHLPESTQTHVHWVGDAIQPSQPLSSPSPPALNLSRHQGLFLWSRAILIQQVSPGGWSRIKFESPSPLQAGSYLVMINFICQLDWASGGPRQILFWVCLCWCVRIRLPVLSFLWDISLLFLNLNPDRSSCHYLSRFSGLWTQTRTTSSLGALLRHQPRNCRSQTSAFIIMWVNSLSQSLIYVIYLHLCLHVLISCCFRFSGEAPLIHSRRRWPWLQRAQKWFRWNSDIFRKTNHSLTLSFWVLFNKWPRADDPFPGTSVSSGQIA